MRILAGDTWGISGPTFIGVYVVLAVAALAVYLVVRRVVCAGPLSTVDQQVPRLEAAPTDVAYLNGGDHLAILSACSALYTIGALTATPDRKVAAVPVDLPPGLPRLAYAVYEAARRGIRQHQMRQLPAIAAELATVRDRLIGAGLFLSPAMRRKILWVWLLLPLVLVLGLVRLAAGIAGGKPVGYLMMCLMGCAVLVVLTGGALAQAKQTVAGRRVLRQLRVRRDALRPSLKPSWASYGPAAAALGVGVFGANALWAADPQFARGLGLSQAGSSGDGGGSGCGGGGGCGGGCGG